MRVLVTGGAGFIGSHITDALIRQGVEVAVLDDLSTGRRENISAGARFFEVDVRDAAAVRAAFDQFRPTCVSHQAAQASVKVSVEDPTRDAAVNVLGGLHVLEAARATGVQRVVFASTGGAIYGEVDEAQQATEAWARKPKSPYAASKASFEYFLDVYAQNFGLSHTVLRYANVYGPRQDPHGEAGVVAIFAGRLKAKQPVTLYARRQPGDDGCVRDYVFVDDVVTANVMALEGKLPGLFNVGTGVPASTRDVLDAVASSLGVTPQVNPAGIRPGDLERSVLDNSKLRATGWQVSAALREGIGRTVDWFRAR
jgi:UDP-glucose 4-epimerase